MEYSEALDYLYHSLPMFSRVGAKAIKKDLKNTLALCAFLDNPQNKIQTIHIAGTNGKGSVAHMMSAIFQSHGFRTGLYTSPHINDFRERIKINGEWIEEAFVVDFVEKTKRIAEDINPSFFELTFVMALDYFNAKNVDVAIIETGLGGRLDSTNVIQPVLSIITSIGMDHMDVLGDTKEKIAFEKAGIIKKNTPVVIGNVDADIHSVFTNKAHEVNAPIYFAAEKYQLSKKGNSDDLLHCAIQDQEHGTIREYAVDLAGIYQVNNLVTVLQSVEVLKDKFDLNDATIIRALSHTKELTGLHGRWEILHKDPWVIMDVAHNEDGVRVVLDQVKNMPHKKLHLVFGMVKDKDVHLILKLLPTTAQYYFTQAAIPRALNADELRTAAADYQLHGESFSEVKKAVDAALTNLEQGDILLIFGSFFIVSEVDVKLIHQWFQAN